MYSKILNVAAYCRVSTDHADQLHSLTAQIKYFTDYIGANPNWRLKEVYFDEGISAVSVKKRDGFNRMIKDAEDGKIDLILTKEVSRFARNTVDTLTFTRKLTAINVGVIFTNDNIDTREKDGELRLTIMASIAQEESRKTSERVKWGIRRKMESGLVFGNGKMLGFRVVNGVLEIVPEEAEIVKRIFNMYLYEKKSLYAIARALNEDGTSTLNGGLWQTENISRLLHNDKYVGDLTQHKRTTADYLTGQLISNKDNLIHVSDHHQGIISRDVWDSVQAQLQERSALSKEGRKYSKRNWYSTKTFCGKCGKTYVTGTGGNSGKRSVKCNNRIKNGNVVKVNPNGEKLGCDNKCINEKALSVFMNFILLHVQNSRTEIVNDMLSDIKQMQKLDKPIDTKPLETAIESNMRKKRKAYDLMLDEQMSKDDLLEQTAFYDSEIARLTEEINDSQSLSNIHQMQIDEVRSRIAEVNKTAEINADNIEIYSELLDKFVVNAHENNVIVYLKCMPIGFKLFYHTYKNPKLSIFDVIIDKYEVVD
ncbi:MAG: recombinase family protein [Oscillospiraceae bacterium]|nr:recombinase family protein [Oscillospiraceae bacterium]